MNKAAYYNVDGSGKLNFFSKTKFFVGLSVLFVLASLFLIFTKGFNYGIDFSGGTEIQVKFEDKIDPDKVRNFVEDLKLSGSQIQKFGESNEYLIRFQGEQGKTPAETNELLNQAVNRVTQGLQTTLAEFKPEIRRTDSVGPQVGNQLKKNSLLAAFYGLLVILIYVGLRFDYIFAPGAVICLFHDAIVTLGILVLMGKEINVQVLAAILTIIGYSLNDTIIIFDRIRENIHSHSDRQLPWIINRSMNEMLVRSILTSTATLMSTVCLFIFAMA